MHLQIFSTNSIKTAIHEDLDPRNISTIRYFLQNHSKGVTAHRVIGFFRSTNTRYIGVLNSLAFSARILSVKIWSMQPLYLQKHTALFSTLALLSQLAFFESPDRTPFLAHWAVHPSPLTLYSHEHMYQKVRWYFLCREGLGSKWPSVLKVWEQLCANHSRVSQNTYRQKAFAILWLKMPQEFCSPYSQLEKNKLENFILLSFLLTSSCITQKP